MPDKKTVKIGRKSYEVRSPNRMNRATIRQMKEVQARAAGQDPEALWELLELFVPDAKGEAIDSLDIDGVQDVLRDADLISGELDEPSLGESLASTVS